MGALDDLRSDLDRVQCPFALSRLRAVSVAAHPDDFERDAVFALRMFEVKLASVASTSELDGFARGLVEGLSPERGLSDAAPALASRIAARRAELMERRR